MRFPVTKIKKELITKAKVKKEYAKVKAEYQKNAPANPFPTHADPTEPESSKSQTADQQLSNNGPQMHPERQAMLEAASAASSHPENEDKSKEASGKDKQEEGKQDRSNDWRTKKKRRPDYFSKELAEAEKAKKKAEERAVEKKRREEEKQKRIAERERLRKMMAKARRPGKDGKRKLGRESTVLLEKVKKLMGKE